MSKKRKNSVNLSQVSKEVSKIVKSYDSVPQGSKFSDGAHGEVAPGSVVRESPLSQQMGTAAYRRMIQDHNEKNKDLHSKLPFTFLKKRKVRSHLTVMLVCPECSQPFPGTEFTYGVICSGCSKFVKPVNPEARAKGYHTDATVGIGEKFFDKNR